MSRPVISVGNLTVGGAGKTPMVAYISRLLCERGERPAVLTRGYARRRAEDGVTVVSDGRRVLADVASAGDEPLMLARALPGVAVLVSADRHLAGLLAERQFCATVHILDDGFQHVQLSRTVDLLLVEEEDLVDRVLPAGRLREPLADAPVANAVLVTTDDGSTAERVGRALGVGSVFRVARAFGAFRSIPSGDPVVVPAGRRLFATAAIARPERFFSDLVAAGWPLAGSIGFRDHHRFTPHDIARVAAAAKASGAAMVVTTEKDAVRLAACDLGDLPVASVALTVGVEPAAAFRDWLLDRL